jgi:hypothetical protein
MQQGGDGYHLVQHARDMEPLWGSEETMVKENANDGYANKFLIDLIDLIDLNKSQAPITKTTLGIVIWCLVRN